MNIVERAIILAAGTGTRLLPVTRSIPKPLVPVNGIPMIESVINALYENDIREIYVVTGYMKEKFQFLKRRYADVNLIENPMYNGWNNLASLYAARNYLSNCMILDGDQIICNPQALDKHFQLSGYNVVWSDTKTEEWLLHVNNGIVTGCERTGGNTGWQLFSVSRWTDADGKKLQRHLEMEIARENRQIYWDDLALFSYPEEYTLGIYPMHTGDVIEIDSFEELLRLDPSYASYLQENR